MLASKNGHAEVVEMLCAAPGIEKNMVRAARSRCAAEQVFITTQRLQALFAACKLGDLSVVQALVAGGASDLNRVRSLQSRGGWISFRLSARRCWSSLPFSNQTFSPNQF
jgi:hypothetical protein